MITFKLIIHSRLFFSHVDYEANPLVRSKFFWEQIEFDADSLSKSNLFWDYVEKSYLVSTDISYALLAMLPTLIILKLMDRI